MMKSLFRNTAKRVGLLLAACWLCTMIGSAQEAPKKFSPEQFDQELRQCIIKEACLTTEEAEKFFPVYKEMQQQQRQLFMRQRQLGTKKPNDENGCKKAIQERDDIEMEQKRIQQTYHNKFFDLLPASKVYDILQAEERFHRNKLRQWGRGGNRPGPKKNK